MNSGATHPSPRGFDRRLPRKSSIVDHESVSLIARHNHPKLLRGPLGCRMRRRVPMQDSSGSRFQHDKDIDHAKCCGHDDKEIAREHRARVVPHEGAPRLCALLPARWSRPHIRSHRSRRDVNTQFEEELVSDPFLTPRPIRRRHRGDSCCRPTRIGGRPGARDFQRQNNRNPFRCQRMRVSGLTTMSR